jgi:hypothetical protein
MYLKKIIIKNIKCFTDLKIVNNSKANFRHWKNKNMNNLIYGERICPYWRPPQNAILNRP